MVWHLCINKNGDGYVLRVLNANECVAATRSLVFKTELKLNFDLVCKLQH